MHILPILVFILILAVLVIAHEFGHFIMAKRAGMQVDEFGFGFPPRLFSFRKGETLYSLNLIPLGGFVRIVGENNEDGENPRSFINKTFTQRLLTLVAGVLMNFLLAWVLFSIGFGLGLPTQVSQGDVLPKGATLTNTRITILETAPNSPAEKAGLRAGDVILKINSETAESIDQISEKVKSAEGQQVSMHIARGTNELDISVFARPDPPKDQGATGIALGLVGKIKYPWYQTPIKGFEATINVIAGTASAFYHLLFQGQGLSSLGGPVKIASLTGQVTELGFAYVLQFAAFLSVNLGILNIFPFPALDGGRVLFLLIEKIRGKRNNQYYERLANAFGFALLLLLIIIISVRDVRSLF